MRVFFKKVYTLKKSLKITSVWFKNPINLRDFNKNPSSPKLIAPADVDRRAAPCHAGKAARMRAAQSVRETRRETGDEPSGKDDGDVQLRG